ncbi:hypothetical protein GQ53DRAFT_141496 [Thozetella sp. PMI_491]|nr:hypothetical protein GQ53DRAFT_141496 [Thozetella sp. PMI_491]
MELWDEATLEQRCSYGRARERPLDANRVTQERCLREIGGSKGKDDAEAATGDKDTGDHRIKLGTDSRGREGCELSASNAFPFLQPMCDVGGVRHGLTLQTLIWGEAIRSSLQLQSSLWLAESYLSFLCRPVMSVTHPVLIGNLLPLTWASSRLPCGGSSGKRPHQSGPSS